MLSPTTALAVSLCDNGKSVCFFEGSLIGI
jgi:hypothetical protein